MEWDTVYNGPELVGPEEAQELMDELFETYAEGLPRPPATSEVLLFAFTELTHARRKQKEAESVASMRSTNYDRLHENYMERVNEGAKMGRELHELRLANQDLKRREERAIRMLDNALAMGIRLASIEPDCDED